MKKLLIITSLAIVGYFPMNAQEDVLADATTEDLSGLSLTDIERKTLELENESMSLTLVENVKFGVIGGLVCSTITGDDAESFTNRISFHIGVMALMSLSEEFALQGELLYAGMGSDYEETFELPDLNHTRQRGGGGSLTGSYKLDYLILLIVAKYYVAQGFSLEAGPQFGFLLSAKDEFNFSGDTGEEDVKDQTKGFDFGVSGGAGYEFAMGLYLKIRYYLGLLEVNDFRFPGNESWKNGALFASVGWFFD